jgi:biopolymer transport protein ExbD
MAQALGTNEKGSVNVDLNIVPFIDLMSCLTAFLLVTAVWIQIANVPTAPAGRGGGSGPSDHPKLAILVEADSIDVFATPSGEARHLPSYDWAGLRGALRELAPRDERPLVEVAANSTVAHPIAYQELVHALDTAIAAGFPDVGVTDVASLTR